MLIGLVAIASGIALLRKALKIAVALIVLAVLAIAASVAVQGAQETQEDLEQAAERISEEMMESEQIPGLDR